MAIVETKLNRRPCFHPLRFFEDVVVVLLRQLLLFYSNSGCGPLVGIRIAYEEIATIETGALQTQLVISRGFLVALSFSKLLLFCSFPPSIGQIGYTFVSTTHSS
uniref:Uncharacterized protein n=1 Tax=Caenorhabditis tropicalis TaxID=1561998 RepID=A0A1I7TCP9_9PELO